MSRSPTGLESLNICERTLEVPVRPLTAVLEFSRYDFCDPRLNDVRDEVATRLSGMVTESGPNHAGWTASSDLSTVTPDEFGIQIGTVLEYQTPAQDLPIEPMNMQLVIILRGKGIIPDGICRTAGTHRQFSALNCTVTLIDHLRHSISEIDFSVNETLRPHVEVGHVQRESLEYEDTVQRVTKGRFGWQERLGGLVAVSAAETKGDLCNTLLMIRSAPANQVIAAQYAANTSPKKPVPHPIYRLISTFNQSIFSASRLHGPRNYLGAVSTRRAS